MTPSKRWYQLSMLQLLVAMAVVAVFVVKNASYWVSTADNDIGLIFAGWPFAYLSRHGFLITTTDEDFRAGELLFSGLPKYNPWMFTLNSALGCLTTFVALQLNFVTRDQLVESMHAWVLDKTKSLGELFVASGAMDTDQFKLLDALVEKHVQKHGGDVQQSLQQLSTVDSDATLMLAEIDDAELEATIQLLRDAVLARS